MINKKIIYSYITQRVMKAFCYNNLKNALKKPLRKEEEILISFLVNWLRARWKTDFSIHFEVAYNRGWLPTYNRIKNNIHSKTYLFFLSTYREAENIVLSNKLYNPAKKKEEQIIGPNFVLNESFTEDEYKNVLYAFYCLYFYNTDILRKCKISKIFNWMKIIKAFVKNDGLYKQYENFFYENNIKMNAKITRMNFYEKTYDYKDSATINMINNFFSWANVVQKYSYWKSYSETDPDFLRRSLFYSLCIRVPQKGTKLEQMRNGLIIRLLYYWYYGVVEEHYVDIIFDILHGKYGEGDKHLIGRLFAEKSVSDKTALNYFRKKYTRYCKDRNIGQDKQVSILKPSNNNDDTQDESQSEPTAYSAIPLQLSKIPDGFTINQLEYLAKLLYDGNGKISLLATIDSKNALPYFLGAPTIPKPPSNYKISWNKDMKSLKYFITRLYDTNTMHGVWKITREAFLIFSKGQLREINSAQSLSNLSSTGSKGYLNIDSKIKDFIDASIASAKSLK